MTHDELANHLSVPLQTLGMSFYFDPGTAGAAEPLGLNMFQFYGVGRAGVLGAASVDDVLTAFYFFAPGAIQFLYGAVKDKVDVPSIAQHYLEAAWAYGDRTFGAVAPEQLRGFADAAFAIISAVPKGHMALFDGYANFARPADDLHAAYQGAVVLRELRGGVHIDSCREVGLSGLEACAYANDGSAKLHGFSDDELPSDLSALAERATQAEARTNSVMASYVASLTDAQRAALRDGADAMFAALQSPVAR
jgi:hypothetical protein